MHEPLVPEHRAKHQKAKIIPRMARAEEALRPYLEGDSTSRAEAATDLLADLKHLADQYNIDLYRCWQVADTHHQSESRDYRDH